VYNLKEAMLAKCYIEVLGLDRHSDAAQRLIKWKQPVDGQVSKFDLKPMGLIASRPNRIPGTLQGCAITRSPLARPSKKVNYLLKQSTPSLISSLPAVSSKGSMSQYSARSTNNAQQSSKSG
jgi:hypothetical protein